MENTTRSIADPALAALFSPGGVIDLDGIVVGERSALQQSPMWRATMVICQQLASLPMPSYTDLGGGRREPVASIFDEPDGPDGQTVFEWKETMYAQLVLHGRAGALKIQTGLGGLARLQLRHPYTWSVSLPTIDEYKSGRLPVGGLWFDVSLDDGSQRRYDARDFWYVPDVALDGRCGVGLLQIARESLKTTIAGEAASAQLFANGALIRAIAVPADADEDIEADIPQIRRELDTRLHGPENAGKIALLNARLNIQNVAMTAVDAQLLQSRQFQIEEVARWTGVPPHILMQTEKQTSWGTGVDEQNRALGRTVLAPKANRVEQRASRLLARPRFAEVDFTKLERPSPDREIELDLSQVAAGVMTIDEYRAKRGWKPLPATVPATAPAADDPGKAGAGDA